MAQQFKQPPVTLASHMSVGSNRGCSTPSLDPRKPAWETAQDGSNAWAPAADMGELKEASGSWLRPGPAPAIATIQE